MSESFATALRAELDAVVGRYEALVRALAEVGGREADALRVEAARLQADNDRLRGDAAAREDEIGRLRGEIAARKDEAARHEAKAAELARRIETLEAEVDRARRTTEAAQAATLAFEEQFAAERRFVEACREANGSLLGEALAAAAGRAVDATSATLSVLKAKGLEALLATAFKERGRSTAQAPLLERERAALPALTAAAGCELIAPAIGTRFSAASMEKGGSVSEPAEEGNVLGVAMPGLRRAGTEGAIVFPRVVVATG